MSDRFAGFKHGQKPKIALPEQFFSEVLPLIDNLGALKVVLFAWWALMQREGEYRFLRYVDFVEDETLLEGLRVAATDLDTALEHAVTQGVLVTATVMLAEQSETLYFMNTPLGRDAVTKIEAGHWQPDAHNSVHILPERPTIYALYEREIGMLTQRIADQLKDAERTYPYEWLVDALDIAVDNNARSWAYIRKILERWQQEGRAHEAPERSRLTDGQQYTSGKWSQFIDS